MYTQNCRMKNTLSNNEFSVAVYAHVQHQWIEAIFVIRFILELVIWPQDVVSEIYKHWFKCVSLSGSDFGSTISSPCVFFFPPCRKIVIKIGKKKKRKPESSEEESDDDPPPRHSLKDVDSVRGSTHTHTEIDSSSHHVFENGCTTYNFR